MRGAPFSPASCAVLSARARRAYPSGPWASATPAYRPDPRRLTDTLRELLAGRGLNEVLTHVLIAPADHERLGYDGDDPAIIRVANPVTADRSEMRRSLVPGLLGVLAGAERRRRDAAPRRLCARASLDRQAGVRPPLQHRHPDIGLAARLAFRHPALGYLGSLAVTTDSLWRWGFVAAALNYILYIGPAVFAVSALLGGSVG